MKSTRLNELKEKRGAKLKEASALINLAQSEKRDLKAEELAKINLLHSEAETIAETVLVEARQLSLESGKIAVSEGEKRTVAKFDYARLLNHLHRCAKGQPSNIDGLEAELLQEGEREARAAGINSAGVILPRLLVRSEQRDVTASGTTSVTGDQGGMTVATNKSGLLDDFYNASVIRAAGATVLEGLTSNLDLPRLTAGTASAGKSENAAADETTLTTAMLQLSPKRLPSYIDISERLLLQSSAAIETVLRNNLSAQMVATQEAAFFHGTGTNEANGVAGTSGIGSVAGGTNGLAPALTHLTQLEEKVDAQNALLGNLHYITNGQIRKKLKETAKVASTDSRMLLDNDGLINGYSPYFTNAVSRTLTKGTSSSVCSAVFFGNWRDYVVGYWGGVSVEIVRDKTNATTGLYTLVASAYYDGGVVRPKSFAAMLDALGA